MKIKIIILILIVIIVSCGIFYLLIYQFILNKKISRVIVKDFKTIQTSSTTYKIITPIASLPKETEKKEKYDIIEGEIILVPSNTAEPNSSLMMTVLLNKKNNETIALTNGPYVTTLRKLYLNKIVKLKGKWRKDAIIYGRRYKCFWIEDFELSKKGE